MIIADRVPGGPPGPAHGVTGWGIPAYGRAALVTGHVKPTPVGARYFCGDCGDGTVPVAQGNMYSGSKAEYQEAVTGHYTDEHPDLHYPIDQTGIDAMQKAKRKADKILRLNKDLADLKKWSVPNGVRGGLDWSGSYQPVARPRELPDFTEFDFPDAAVADDGAEEIELDQLISIQARQGRRLLGVELQNLDVEANTEFLTAPDNADLDIGALLELNTRTGGFNLDDAENLWRARYFSPIANIEATAGVGTAVVGEFLGINDIPPGGLVYVAPRLFWRFTNALDRQVDTGDLFTRIATVNQPLSTFLLFELLEQFSGLFGLT